MSNTITKELVLINKYGMHVRPAGLFAKTASHFTSEVTVTKDDVTVPGKSIMALMTLEAICGATLKVSATGGDAQDAVNALESLINQKFNLPEE